MKILDILNEASQSGMMLGNIPFITRNDTKGLVDWSKMKHIDAGAEGDVYETRSGNSVLKVVRLHEMEAKNNSYMRFVSVCLAHQDNPFFPKIFSAKVYRIRPEQQQHTKTRRPADSPYDEVDEHAMNVLVVHMERLIPIDMVSDAVRQKVFGRLEMKTFTDNHHHPQKFKDKLLANDLGTRRNVRKMIESTTNVNFRTALQALQHLFAVFDGDTHSGNWMIRNSGSGPQLVIIDPIQPYV